MAHQTQLNKIHIPKSVFALRATIIGDKGAQGHALLYCHKRVHWNETPGSPPCPGSNQPGF